MRTTDIAHSQHITKYGKRTRAHAKLKRERERERN